MSWWSTKASERVQPELMKDQVMEAKKVELQTFAKKGVYEVVDRSEAELNPESVMLPAKFHHEQGDGGVSQTEGAP